MSVASEFPPEVHIPARARRGTVGARHLVVVPSGSVLLDPWTVPAPPIVEKQRQSGPTTRHVAAPSRICAEEVRSVPLRLTRRGTIALAALGVVAAGLFLLIAHLSLGLAPHAGSATTGSVDTPSTVMVQNGDTLWSIAQRVDPSADPRAVVDQIRRANHLSTVDLSPGQTLKLR